MSASAPGQCLQTTSYDRTFLNVEQEVSHANRSRGSLTYSKMCLMFSSVSDENTPTLCAGSAMIFLTLTWIDDLLASAPRPHTSVLFLCAIEWGGGGQPLLLEEANRLVFLFDGEVQLMVITLKMCMWCSFSAVYNPNFAYNPPLPSPVSLKYLYPPLELY